MFIDYITSLLHFQYHTCIFIMKGSYKKMKKSIVVILSLSLLILSACAPATSAIDPYGTKESKQKVTTDNLDDMTYIIQVDDIGISKERYTDTVMANAMQFTGGNFSYLTDGSEDAKEVYSFIKEYSADTILREEAILALAADAGIILDEEDEVNLQTAMNDLATQNGGMEALEEALSQSYTTIGYYENQLMLQLVTSELYEYYFGENGTMTASTEELKAIAQESYVLAKHILVDETSLEDATDAEGEPFETLEDLANFISDSAKDGEDFDALIEQYNTDPGVASSPDGYFFTYGTMVSEFETAAFEMEVGDISDPVSTTYGYHILQKLPINDDVIAANSATMESAYATEKLGELIEEKLASFNVTYTSQYDNLTIDILVPELVTG